MTFSLEETWEKLVWAKKPCPCLEKPCCIECQVDGGHSHDCSHCYSGTGFVLLLPLLSEECRQIHNKSSPDFTARWQTSCKEAGCTGRVPKPMHLETLLISLYDIPADKGRYDIYKSVLEAFGSHTQLPEALDAAYRAAWKAVQVRYPQEER